MIDRMRLRWHLTDLENAVKHLRTQLLYDATDDVLQYWNEQIDDETRQVDRTMNVDCCAYHDTGGHLENSCGGDEFSK